MAHVDPHYPQRERVNKPDFEAELEDLFIRANNSNLDLRGSFSVEHPSSERPNYEILVTEFKTDTELP